jgi:hypothetical protein
VIVTSTENPKRVVDRLVSNVIIRERFLHIDLSPLLT